MDPIGELGTRTSSQVVSLLTIRFPGEIRSINIYKDLHTVILESGRCFAWGNNHHMQINSSSMHKVREPKEIELLLGTIPGYVSGNAGRLAFKDPSDSTRNKSPNRNKLSPLNSAETQVLFQEVVSKHDVTFYMTNKVDCRRLLRVFSSQETSARLFYHQNVFLN